MTDQSVYSCVLKEQCKLSPPVSPPFKMTVLPRVVRITEETGPIVAFLYRIADVYATKTSDTINTEHPNKNKNKNEGMFHRLPSVTRGPKEFVNSQAETSTTLGPVQPRGGDCKKTH